MDLPCPRWQNHVAQKWNRLDPELKERFTSLLEVDDVFKFALSLTNQHDLDWLQSVSTGHLMKKDREEAAICRERGNSCFKARDFKAAALHYSQGVCLAPQHSDQLSLCYSNRSAALLHLQLYHECLDDTDRALKSGYPSHLSHKLQNRRTQCLNHLAGYEKTGKDDQSSFSKNNKGVGSLRFGIRPQVSVGYSLDKGRHLVAEKKIAAGEVILTERPYSCVLIPGMKEVQGKKGGEMMFGMEHRRCHRCLAETLSPMPCEGCSYSRYCSTSCQSAAWGEHHRWECPLGADLIVMGVMAQLALRVTLKAGLANIQTARQPIRDKHKKLVPYMPSSSDPYLTTFHLLHHINNQSTSLRFLCAVTIATLYLRLSKEVSLPGFSSSDGPNMEGGDEELWVMGSASLRHMLQLRCNAQAIITLQDTGAENSRVQSREELRLATAMFPALSLLNHSCCPNTSLVFSTGAAADPRGPHKSADISEGLPEDEHKARGVSVTVRAARDITPGQEILHCYGPHCSRMATKERQRLLQEQYYFLCECEACSVQEGQQQQQDSTRGSRDGSGLLCLKCKEALERVCESRGGDFTCRQPTCGHRMSSAEVSHELQEVRVALERAVEHMETEKPDEALRLLKKTKSRSGWIIAETHPLHGALADATARAYASMGDWKNAAVHLEQSVVATGSQYGEDSVELGQQLFKLAQLYFNGGARDAALFVIPKVRQILSLHCGPHCPELQELKAMEECLRG